MGLLDDAIREHLDLKRRRGADPTEIERAEREALGPVRRGPEVGGDDAPAASTAVESAEPPENWEPPHEDDDLQEPRPAFEHDDELPPYEPEEHLHDDAALGATRPFDAEAETAPTAYPADVEPVPPEPEPEPEPSFPPHAADAPEPAVPQHLDQETEEYELEPEEGDDVLESTPEFLQDAPDHDRLWFEQRPPRDFDFDG
ncbi:MAG: hypothetical protein ACLQA5_02570 [Solirubrobacteraceae bacterium]